MVPERRVKENAACWYDLIDQRGAYQGRIQLRVLRRDASLLGRSRPSSVKIVRGYGMKAKDSDDLNLDRLLQALCNDSA